MNNAYLLITPAITVPPVRAAQIGVPSAVRRLSAGTLPPALGLP